MPKRGPCRELSCSSLIILRSRRHLFPHKVEKRGFLEHPSCSPSCTEILEMKKGRIPSPGAGHCGAPLPSALGRGGSLVPLGSHLCPHSPFHADTCWISTPEFCWNFLWAQYSSQAGLLYLGPWKNSSLFQFIICLSIAKRICLGFHHTALQLHKLFITEAKIEAVLFWTFFLFFPFKFLITACCEVVCLFILLIYLEGIIPDFDGAPWT